VGVVTTDPYVLIEATAARSHRRALSELLAPAAPPAVALVIAWTLGVLPVEIAVAAAIAGALLLLHASEFAPSRIRAARFLDDTFGAKDRFLTLATARAQPLLPLVAEEARTIASHRPEVGLPPPRKRPLVTSIVLSIAALALLWLLPHLASFASAGPGDLDRIAAELAAAGDADGARVVSEAARALRDPKLSNQEKLAKVQEALRELAAQEQKQGSGSGKSAGGGEKGGDSRQQKGKESKGQGEQGEGSGAKTQAAGGGSGGSGQARGEAKQELSKIAGELAGEQQQAKSEKPQSGKQQQPAGGGIQGPENGAQERKPGDRDSAGNQPGKNPDKPGGEQKPGGNEGASQAQRQGDQPNQPEQSGQANAAKGSGGAGEGPGQRSSSQADAKPAERYYKAGESGEGGIRDGRYVRVQVPEENRALPGTELVAKPGDASPETPYGNAPLPPAGAPGEVGAEQPVPLEYRDAFKSDARRER